MYSSIVLLKTCLRSQLYFTQHSTVINDYIIIDIESIIIIVVII